MYHLDHYFWSINEQQTPTTMNTNNTPARYISAMSWNGTEFYFNTIELTWEMADNTVLTMAHDATDADLFEARMAAKRENFLADELAIHQYVEC